MNNLIENPSAPIAVVGTTVWGITLSVMLAKKGTEVRLLARTEQEAKLLNTEKESTAKLPGFKFPERLFVTHDPLVVFHDVNIILMVVPSSSMRANAAWVNRFLNANSIVVSAAKGLEAGSTMRMSEVLANEIPTAKFAALSGPNLAREIINNKPASTVVSSKSLEVSLAVQSVLNSPMFRVYTNSDIIGTELAGAFKNIIAIGAGVVDGIDLGDNAKSGLVTRGLSEMTRLGVAAGGEGSTFAGLSGLGDLIVTCYSGLSRNYKVGLSLSRGLTAEQAVKNLGGEVAEGISSTPVALSLAQKLGVELPLTEVIQELLSGEIKTDEAIAKIMNRSPRNE